MHDGRRRIPGPGVTLTLLVALIVLQAAGGAAAQQINAAPFAWTYVPVDGAVCGQPGTTAGFFINPTTPSRKLLIAFSGGGACFHQGDCRASDLNGFSPDSIIESLGLTPGLDRADPSGLFFDYNLIWVPYCTGDFHMGANVAPYGIQHMGYANVGRYLDVIVPAFPDAERIVVTGESAGSFGATFNYDRIRRAFNGKRVDLIADSGPFLPPPSMPTELQDALDANWGFRANLPAGCPDCATSWDALYAYLSATWPDARFSLLSHLQDDSVLSRFALYGSLVTLDDYANALNDLADRILGPLPNFRVFYEPGPGHGFTFDSAAQQTIVSGVSLDQFLRQQLNDDPAWANVRPAPGP